jgi:antitoxin (DNA-binding transcriptional repressor) of toxin-antitoxin stability system
MEMTATALRKNLYASLDKVLEGEALTVVYKGVPLTITASRPTGWLSKLKKRSILIGNRDAEEIDRELLATMEKEWQEDWKNL